MKTIHTTETFNTWFTGLRDKQAAARIQMRIDRAEDGNSAIARRWVKVLQKCGFTTGRVGAFTSLKAAWR